MKFKRVILVLLLALAGGLAWMLFLKKTTPSAVAEHKPILGQSFVSTRPAPAMVVETPKIAPAPASKPDTPRPETPKPALLAATQSDFKPQAELKDAIAQTIRIFQAQDFVAALKYVYDPAGLGFLSTINNKPPTAEEYAGILRQNPDAINRMELLLQAFQAIQDETPELNDDGTSATYRIFPSVGDYDQVTFVKVNGCWYLVQALD